MDMVEDSKSSMVAESLNKIYGDVAGDGFKTIKDTLSSLDHAVKGKYDDYLKRGGKRGKKRECGPSAGQRRRERAMAMRSECESRKLENITEKEFDELFDFAERRWAEMEDAQPGRHEDKGTRFPTNEASERAFSRPTLDMLVGMCDGSVKTAKNCLKRMDFSGRKSISYVLKDTVENKDMMPPILKMAKGSGLCPCAVIPDPKW
jgi:hypothetical protein